MPYCHLVAMICHNFYKRSKSFISFISCHTARHTTHPCIGRRHRTHTHTHAEDVAGGNCPLLFTHPELPFLTGSQEQWAAFKWCPGRHERKHAFLRQGFKMYFKNTYYRQGAPGKTTLVSRCQYDLGHGLYVLL